MERPSRACSAFAWRIDRREAALARGRDRRLVVAGRCGGGRSGHAVSPPDSPARRSARIADAATRKPRSSSSTTWALAIARSVRNKDRVAGRDRPQSVAARQDIRTLSVKLSAVPRLFRHEPYPFRDVTPHIRRLFDAYGPRRCYWGTDMTNSFAKATYRQRITHFTEELDFLSEDDKDWIMGRAILARLKWA